MIPALIMVTTIATSSTGGNYAGPGGVVQTGSESASSYVRTEVNGTSSTTVHVETSVNGAATSSTEVLPPGTPATVQIEVSNKTVPTARVRVAPTVRKSATPKALQAASSTSAVSTSTGNGTASSSIGTLTVPAPSAMVPPPLGVRLMMLITNFMRSLLSFVQ